MGTDTSSRKASHNDKTSTRLKGYKYRVSVKWAFNEGNSVLPIRRRTRMCALKRKNDFPLITFTNL